MRTMAKITALAASAVVLVTASVAGTMAYLTSRDSVENTFTVGQVHIDLKETDVTKEGSVMTDEGNHYHLLPGGEYVKDPTVTVLKGSDECYVRVKLVVHYPYPFSYLVGLIGPNGEPDFNMDPLKTDFFTGVSDAWEFQGGVYPIEAGVNTAVYEYRYKETVTAPSENVVLPSLFTGLSVPSEWDNDEMAYFYYNNGNFGLDVYAEAIQKIGTADESWQAFDAQMNAKP